MKRDGSTYESESKHGRMKRLRPLFHATMRLEQMLLPLDDRHRRTAAVARTYPRNSENQLLYERPIVLSRVESRAELVLSL